MTLICLMLIISALIILFTMIKGGRFVYCLFLSSLSGIGSLFAVNTLGSITGVTLGVNDITLLISSIGGIPGVIGLLTVRAFMNYTLM